MCDRSRSGYRCARYLVPLTGTPAARSGPTSPAARVTSRSAARRHDSSPVLGRALRRWHDDPPLVVSRARSNSYWTTVIGVPHPGASAETEERVDRLVRVLLGSLDAGSTTVAELARVAGLEHETVRRLWRNPGGRLRYGPGFFIVDALARAEGLSLDALAARVRDPR